MKKLLVNIIIKKIIKRKWYSGIIKDLPSARLYLEKLNLRKVIWVYFLEVSKV